MAEESSGGITHGEAAGRFAWILIALFLFASVLNALSNAIPDIGLDKNFVRNWILGLLEPYLIFLYVVAFVISGVLIGVLIYMRQQIERIVSEERDKLYPAEGNREYIFGVEDTKPVNPRWHRIEQHVASDSQGDWRVAILEADIMLEEMLESMGYRGETIGERLKHIERSDFTTLDAAWEAHKVRNQIAHEGSDYQLSRREAERVVGLFREVFEEFRFI